MYAAMLLVSSRSIFVLIGAELQYKEVPWIHSFYGNIIHVYFVNVLQLTNETSVSSSIYIEGIPSDEHEVCSLNSHLL